MKVLVYDYEQRHCDENELMGKIIEVDSFKGEVLTSTCERVVYKDNCFPIMEGVEPSDEALGLLAKTLAFIDTIKAYVVESITTTGEANIEDAVQCAMEKFLNGFK